MSEVLIGGLGRPYNALPLPSWLKEITSRDTEVFDFGNDIQVHALATKEAVGIALGKLERFKNAATEPLQWTVTIDTSTRTLTAKGVDRKGNVYSLRVSKVSHCDGYERWFTALLVAKLLGSIESKQVNHFARQLIALRAMSGQPQEIKWKQ